MFITCTTSFDWGRTCGTWSQCTPRMVFRTINFLIFSWFSCFVRPVLAPYYQQNYDHNDRDNRTNSVNEFLFLNFADPKNERAQNNLNYFEVEQLNLNQANNDKVAVNSKKMLNNKMGKKESFMLTYERLCRGESRKASIGQIWSHLKILLFSSLRQFRALFMVETELSCFGFASL